MKYLIKFIVLFIVTNLSAQTSPKITLQDESELKLSKLFVKAEISGQYASVTYDMTFYNGLNRILEGELAFPLAQGQTVSNLAMDLNGQLRDAVIVEKELGRVAYESTIKQRIDPALLEQTKGNNYKVRVYPIPANGYKRIVITYEENLAIIAGNYQFNIPFDIKNKIDEFELNIVQSSDKYKPVVGKKYSKDLVFKSVNKAFVAQIKKQSTKVNSNLKLAIPIQEGLNLITEKDYFFLNTSIEGNSKIKKNPKSIDLLWDASYSMFYKNKDKEFQLLDAYIKSIGDITINLVVFNNVIVQKKSFKIIKGNWSDLKNRLNAVIYDGGTSFNNLQVSKADEIILVSDGMHNLGELELYKKSKLYAINSVKSANHQYLENSTNAVRGNYINLNRVSVKSALKKLRNEPFQFLGIKGSNRIFETYPKANTTVTEGFILGGKFYEADKFQMQFGYNGKVTRTIEVDFNKASNSSMAKRLWAKSKLKHLLTDKVDNKDAIIKHCKENHLISEYTSMIVLDRIEDYVRYKIEPPKELLAEYKRQLSNSKQEELARNESIKSRQEELLDDYETFRDWYNKDFKVKVKKTKKPIDVSPQVITPTESRISNASAMALNRNLDTTKPIISGVVTDGSDLPLPGVNVIIRGTITGVFTDFDGLYAINANPDDVLVFSSVGMKTTEVTLGNRLGLNVKMEEDSASLDEVVVTGYAADSQRRTVSAAVSRVSSEELEEVSSKSNDETLSGKASGVNIETNSGESEKDTSLQIRGLSSLNVDKQPLYVIDGKIVEESYFKALTSNQIASVSILKDAGAAAIYGNRGVNGVMVITTKDGLENDSSKIDDLNSKIEKATKLQSWEQNASYLQLLNAQIDIDAAYNLYLDLRLKYNNTPSFFLDVAEYFEKKENYNYAFKIISNLIEIDIDNHELIRALGYKLTEYKEYKTAVYVFKEILNLRPEEPQSYRDLALAYIANNQNNLAFDLLHKIVKGELLHKDINYDYYGIERIAYNELCHLVNSDTKFKKYRKKFPSIETDIRVVIDWNHANTDLDLYIDNPAGDKIYYSNKTSKYGGILSEDMRDGYGPETFIIRKALKGEYKISIKYFSDSVQKIIGPTNLKVTIIENYGRKNETRRIKVYRLENDDGTLQAGIVKI